MTYAIGTPPAGSGLVGGHAYMVDSVIRAADGTPTGLLLRNPWGIDGYACKDGVNDGYVMLAPKQALDAMGAEQLANSVIYNDTAYDIIEGFIGEPIFP